MTCGDIGNTIHKLLLNFSQVLLLIMLLSYGMQYACTSTYVRKYTTIRIYLAHMHKIEVFRCIERSFRST